MRRTLAVLVCSATAVVWLPTLAGAAYADAQVVSAGAAANNGGADHIDLVRIGDSIRVSVNGAPTSSIPLAGLTSLTVQGSNDDDTLTVDASGGLIALPGGITYDGAVGFDSLALVNNGGPAIASSNATVGPSTGGGQSVMSDGTNTQTVTYLNLEPVVDNVPAATATVNGTNAPNAINYTTGVGAGSGLVSVDNFETYEFTNKTNLIINGLAGSDQINLNHPGRPTGLTGTVTVNAGDPSIGDTLTLNGRDGDLDNLRYVPSGARAGTVINDSVDQPNVIFTGSEKLHIALRAADSDGVRAEGTTGDDVMRYFHGPTADSGVFQGSMDTNNATGGPFPMTEMSFDGAFFLANDSDVNFFNPGGTDSFEYNGTTNADNVSVGTGEAGGVQLLNIINNVFVSRPEVFNVASVIVRGLDGNDVFNANMPAGPSATAINIQGDTGDDILNYSAPTDADTTVNFATSTITSTSPNGNPITYSGIDRLNETSSGATSTLLVYGTTGPDGLVYTPTGPTTGDVALPGAPALSFTGVGSTFTLDPLAGSDTVTVNGTASPENLKVSGQSVANTLAEVVGAKGVSLVNATTESLLVLGGAGGDIFTAQADAGLPISTTYSGGAGDLANVVGNGAGIAVNLGNPAEVFGGGIAELNLLDVAHIDVAGGGGALTVLGTAGNDTFDYRPTAADAGEVIQNGAVPQLDFAGIGGDFTIAPLGGDDLVRVVGSNVADTFTVDVHGTTTVAVGALKPLLLFSDEVELLKLSGGNGADTFNVNTFDDGSLELLVDGALPTGDPAGIDALKVTKESGVGGRLKTRTTRPKGSGTVIASYPTGASVLVSYKNIEKVTPKP